MTPIRSVSDKITDLLIANQASSGIPRSGGLIGMTSVTFVYGWSEGPWHSKKFRQQLLRIGFILEKNPSKADIVIAHSSGCYLVPKVNQAKLILLIGTIFWPGRNLLQMAISYLVTDFKIYKQSRSLGWWLNKLLRNFFYVFTRPKATFQAATKLKVNNLPESRNGQKVLFIRNSHDTFKHPDAHRMIAEARHYKPVSIYGAHDDCWFNPDKYIDLIAKEL